jgi:hypothetical protein
MVKGQFLLILYRFWVILSVGVPLVTNVEAFKLIREVNILLALPTKAKIFCLVSLWSIIA